MTRLSVRPRTALLTAITLTLTTLVAAPASALVDPDGNPVVVDHDLKAHDDDALLTSAFTRASSIEAAAAPKAKKRLKTLVIPVYWSGAGKDTTNKKVQKRAKAAMKKADTYYRTVSRGRIGHKTTVLSWQKISRPGTACGIQYQSEHIAAKANARAKRAGKNPSKYDRVIYYVTEKACGKGYYGVLGLGSTPGRFVWLEGNFSPNVVIHELGHNLGLKHSNYAECRTSKGKRTVLAASKRCNTREYGDQTDVMGNNESAGWLSAPKLARLGWFKGKNLAKNTKTKKKTYTLRPLAASSTKLKSVRVKGTKGRTYWVEYRTRTGLDKRIEPSLVGVQIRLGKPGDRYGDSSVLDMLPTSPFSWNDAYSVSLGARASWTSPEGIRFKVGKVGKTAKVTVQRKVKKAKKPLAPKPKVTATDLGAKITWPYPNDRGTPITSYTVRLKSSDGHTQTIDVSQLNGQVRRTQPTNLDPSKTYSVAVRARNERGSSSWSKSVSFKPLDIRPAVTIHSPAKNAKVKSPVRVQVTPTLPKGSTSRLSVMYVSLVYDGGYIDYVTLDARGGSLVSGKRVSVDVPLSSSCRAQPLLRLRQQFARRRIEIARRIRIHRHQPGRQRGVDIVGAQQLQQAPRIGRFGNLGTAGVVHHAQRPRNAGLRLSRKAAVPSRMSSLANTSPNCAASYSSPSSSPVSPPTRMQSRMPRSASGAAAASRVASAMVSASRSAAGTTRLTIPSCSARAASTGSPVRHSSSAAARPASRSRRWVPPKPGTRPSPISGWPSRAVSAAMRRWQHIASSSPPPRAKPFTIAITGLGRRSKRRIMRCPRRAKSRPCAGVRPAIWAMSAPATKAREPAPVSTTTRTAGSSAASLAAV